MRYDRILRYNIWALMLGAHQKQGREAPVLGPYKERIEALLAEAQIDAAVRHGLAPALADRIVAETMEGTAELLAHRDYDTRALRREVTSPGGSTARGLAALERAGVRAAFQDAIDAVAGWSKG